MTSLKKHLDYPSHKTAPQNHTRHAWFHPFVFTGKAPRKGKRIPLNKIKYNEQRDEETGYGYLPQQVRQAYHGARYMGHELMTMWLSVECYQRTDGKHPYFYTNPKDRRQADYGRKGAHQRAVDKAERLTKSARSKTGREGVAYNYLPRTR